MGETTDETEEVTDRPPLCGLTEWQVDQLQTMLAREHVATREGKFSYIEGHHAIREMNRIFGAAGWSRKTLKMTKVYDGPYENSQSKKGFQVAYLAKVRIKIRTADGWVPKEGTGYGSAITYASISADAHEGAAKEAETDAMKRALMMLGDPLGLALYDKAQAHVEGNAGAGQSGGQSGGQQAPAPAQGDAPLCPKCDTPMVQRNSDRGAFWGCPKYPECKGTRNIIAPAQEAPPNPPDNLPEPDEDDDPFGGEDGQPAFDDEGYPLQIGELHGYMKSLGLTDKDERIRLRSAAMQELWGDTSIGGQLTADEVRKLAKKIEDLLPPEGTE